MPDIPEWLQRLVQEEVVLSQKLLALTKFIRSGKDIGQSKVSRQLLHKQMVAMMDYRAVLIQRLELARKENHLQ